MTNSVESIMYTLTLCAVTIKCADITAKKRHFEFREVSKCCGILGVVLVF